MSNVSIGFVTMEYVTVGNVSISIYRMGNVSSLWIMLASDNIG